MFASREDAGRRLGRHLRDAGIDADLVAGLPRGGVVVAAEVAQVLDLPLDVVVVRKIGHPSHREFAIGALAEGGIVVMDEAAIRRNPPMRIELEEVIREEQERLRRYLATFHPGGRPALEGRSVLLVDDGLATGASAEAAVLAIQGQHANHVIMAAPVASTSAVARLGKVADEVRVLFEDPSFDAVGRYDVAFSQTTDEEVLSLLGRHR